jgi:FkbM family methyltransferase
VDLAQYLQTEPPHLPLLRLLLKRKASITILDVGSCEGEDSLRYLAEFPQSRVFAFEPFPDNVRKIRALITGELSDRFRLIEAAISDEDGEGDLHLSSGQPPGKSQDDRWDYGNKSSSLLEPAELMQRFHPWLQFKKKIRIQTLRLDSFLQQECLGYVDFIHMDIQGAEWKALQGATNLLRKTGLIWIEVAEEMIYSGQPKAADIKALLKSLGFSLLLSCVENGFGDHLYVNPDYFSISYAEQN